MCDLGAPRRPGLLAATDKAKPERRVEMEGEGHLQQERAMLIDLDRLVTDTSMIASTIPSSIGMHLFFSLFLWRKSNETRC